MTSKRIVVPALDARTDTVLSFRNTDGVVDQVVEGKDDGRAVGAHGGTSGATSTSSVLAIGQLRRNPCVASEMSASGSKVSNE